MKTKSIFLKMLLAFIISICSSQMLFANIDGINTVWPNAIRFDSYTVSGSNAAGPTQGIRFFSGSQQTVFSRTFMFQTYKNTVSTLWFQTNFTISTPTINFKLIRKVPGSAPDTFYYLSVNHDYFVNNPIPVHHTVTGIETYELFLWSDQTSDWDFTTSAIFSVIEPVQRAWIEAEPICADNSNPQFAQIVAANKYTFKLKTFPALNNIVYDAPQYLEGLDYQNAVPAAPIPGIWKQQVQIDIDARAGNAGISGGNFSLHSIFGPPTIGNQSSHSPIGTLANTYNWAAQEEFWMPFDDPDPNKSDLRSFIDGAPAGYPVYIDININDGVSFNKTLRAPVLISFPANAQPSAGNIGAYHFDSYTVKGDEVWTPQNNPLAASTGKDETVIKIQTILKIPAGTSLTLRDMIVEIGPKMESDEGTVIVEATRDGMLGGYLKMDHSVITAFRDCGNNTNMWRGVWLYGDPTKSQEPQDAMGRRYQGTLEMINGSELSYAHNAVKCYDPHYGDFSRSGGLLLAKDSRFINNRHAVEIAKYQWYDAGTNTTLPHRCRIRNCEFRTDAQLAYPFVGFISGNAARGVRIEGSSFRNLAGQPAQTAPTFGIAGSDFGVTVTNHYASVNATPVHSVFENLDKGIVLSEIKGIAALKVLEATFTNNGIGVETYAVMAPNIERNTFNMEGINQGGVRINGGSQYVISGNTFTGAPGQLQFGTMIWNTGSDNNLVDANTYKQLWIGNLSNFLNTNADPNAPSGLEFRCNTNMDNEVDIAARGTDAALHGIKPAQGTVANPAGNSFSITAPLHFYELYNPAPEVTPYTYYAGTGIDQLPVNIWGSATAVQVAETPYCTYGLPDNGEAEGRKPGKRIAYHLTDEDGIQSADQLEHVIDEVNSAYGALLRVDLLMERGKDNEAMQVYNAIPASYTLTEPESEEFSNWGLRLMNLQRQMLISGINATSLDPAQVQELETISNNATSWAKVRAQSWLHQFDGRPYELTYLYPEITGIAFRGTPAENKAAQVIVYPNPVSDKVYIKNSGNTSEVIIEDITGKEQLRTTAPGKGNITEVNLSQLAGGIYIFKIIDGQTIVKHGKINKLN